MSTLDAITALCEVIRTQSDLIEELYALLSQQVPEGELDGIRADVGRIQRWADEWG